MAKEGLPLVGNGLTETAQVQGGGDGARGKQRDEQAGYAGKGGKLRLSRIPPFKRKPYDRPLSSSGDRTSSDGGGILPSLPARLVDSASNLITSSASYLFETFFKRRKTLWIGNGMKRAAGRDLTSGQCSESIMEKIDDHVVVSKAGSIKEYGMQRVGNEDTGFVEVEEFLKRKLLSREEVKRLTKVLQTCAHGGSESDISPEAHRKQEMLKKVGGESNPVELAKEYMGRCMTEQRHSLPPRHKEVDRPSPVTGIDERSSGEIIRSRLTPGASTQMLKRRLIADDENNVIQMGPTRRVRQKMTIVANASPYIRQVNTRTGRPQTPSIPALQPSEKTEKSPEPFQELTLPSKGKSVQEPSIVPGPTHIEDVPESSRARDSVHVSDEEPSASVEPSCKLPEPVITTAPTALEKPVSVSLVASTSELPVILPEKNKGFHINAFFEDSSSDDEADLPVKVLASSEAELPRSSNFKEAADVTLVKQPSSVTSTDLPCSSPDDSARRLMPMSLPPLGSAEPSNIKSEVVAAVSSVDSLFTFSASEKPTFSLPSLKPPTIPPHVPAIVAKDGDIRVLPETAKAPLFAATLPSFALPAVSLPPAIPAAEVSSAALLSSVSTTGGLTKAAQQKLEAAETVVPEASCVPQLGAASAETVAPSITTTEAAPKFPAAVSPSASASPVEIGPLFSGTPATSTTTAVLSVASEASMSGGQPIIRIPADIAPEIGGTRPSTTSESPNAADRHGDLDTMVTDSMIEEPDSTTVSSSAPSFFFGLTSNTVPMSNPAFGSSSAPSPFSFAMQSSTSSSASSSVQSPFNTQAGNAAGQPFTFGASGASHANSFSANSQSTFSFGSAAATSMSSTSTASVPSIFPSSSPAPSTFLFGGQAISSSSGFGGQMMSSASAFTSPVVQNNASAFPFQPSPTPLSFQFGGASAGTSSLSSTPSFGGQTFPFGGQPTNATANPFSQSGGSNAAQPSPTAGNPFAQNSGSNAGLFQFGSMAATSSQPGFSSGATAPSSFSFGAQQPPSPSPFTFGAQPTALPTGQQFGFGGQPAAPAQTPFTLPGSTGQSPSGASGMEFTGGFSLGAAGGEKSGRKFIKAKRIGSAKRK